jgi:hypothetical protein
MNKSTLRIGDFGQKIWELNGFYHREDGPAIEYSGSKYWWINGKRHRVDGPAVIYSDGDKSWWLNGIQYTYENWFKLLTPEEQYNYLWNLDE